MAQHMGGKNLQQRGHKPKKFHHTSDNARHKLEVKRWKLEEEEGKRLLSQYESINPDAISRFDELPLSVKTKAGLRTANYTKPTEIQRATIALALQGHDILGAAKTGSGKTLAFLIPVLECLYRNRWSKVDGMGALIISPTRELAYQTFEVLSKVGKKHDFSAALIIGGKDVKSEMERITRTNVVVCTPGRFLQHLDQTVSLECSNLQLLVLDEADRILDLGFEKTMNAILENLPSERQTMLFSATQTKSVRDLARLSLKDPKYIAVHQHHEYSTPTQLEQSYIVCELEQKMDLLYSFIRNHTKHKILVFLASCKQVKYTFEVFCALHPGVTVMALYGTLHQLRRVAIYNEFCNLQHAVLFATDIAARGLDFPAVNWVVQVDCPEDASTYIHRVGRTARYEQGGESLLILLPSEEEEMSKQLTERKIPIQKINVNPNRKLSVQGKLQSLCAGSNDLKQSAQRCFINYIKSVYLMKNKKVFDVSKLPLEKYSFSLGLAIPPRVRFLQRAAKRKEEQKMETQRKKNLKELDGQIPLESSAKTVLKQRRRGLNLAMEEEVEEMGGMDDGLDSIVAKLKSTVPQRMKGGANLTVMSRREEEEGDLNAIVAKLKSTASQRTKGGAKRDEMEKKSLLDEKDDEEEDDETRSATISRSRTGGEDSDQSESSSDEDSDEVSQENENLADFQEEDDQDEEENFLVVKKKDVFGIKLEKPKQRDPATETIESAKKQAKQKKLSKVAEAKKLQRMKIAVNTKKVFDEEGEITKQWPPLPNTADSTEGGIDIEKAKEWMREEDQRDKQVYRERIRAKHKAERLKAKEEKRKFSRPRKQADSDDNEDVGAALDLGNDFEAFDPDTLPDPDKYANEESDTDDDEKDVKKPVKKLKKKKTKKEDTALESTSAKRKAKSEKEGKNSSKKKRKMQTGKEGVGIKEEGEFDTGLTLQDDEALAMHILSSSQF